MEKDTKDKVLEVPKNMEGVEPKRLVTSNSLRLYEVELEKLLKQISKDHSELKKDKTTSI